MSDVPLRRYTDLPSLIYLLSKRKLTLLNPRSWDDKNDSRYLEIYRKKRKLESVLALCFSQSEETYHHWRVFAPGSGGVCIRFDREALLTAVTEESPQPVICRPVTYLTVADIKESPPKTRNLPFLKRRAFEPENEFRMVFESEGWEMEKLDIDIPLSCVKRVTLSPWMHDALSADVKAVLKSIKGCSGLEIVRSTLISNDQWQKHGEKAV